MIGENVALTGVEADARAAVQLDRRVGDLERIAARPNPLQGAWAIIGWLQVLLASPVSLSGSYVDALAITGIDMRVGDVLRARTSLRCGWSAGGGGYLRTTFTSYDPSLTPVDRYSGDVQPTNGGSSGADVQVNHEMPYFVADADGVWSLKVRCVTLFQTGTAFINNNSSFLGLEWIRQIGP